MKTGKKQTLFPADDAQILADAEVLAQESKSSRQFTDVNKFRIKCLDCQIILKGQVEAQDHAKSSGHVRFGEVVIAIFICFFRMHTKLPVELFKLLQVWDRLLGFLCLLQYGIVVGSVCFISCAMVARSKYSGRCCCNTTSTG